MEEIEKYIDHKETFDPEVEKMTVDLLIEEGHTSECAWEIVLYSFPCSCGHYGRIS